MKVFQVLLAFPSLALSLPGCGVRAAFLAPSSPKLTNSLAQSALSANRFGSACFGAKKETPPWSDRQMDQLRKARKEIPGRGAAWDFDEDSYWRDIASYVPGKTPDECRLQSKSLEYRKVGKGQNASAFNLSEDSGLLVYSQPVIMNGQVKVPQGRRILGRNRRFYENQQAGLDAALKAKVGAKRFAEIQKEREEMKKQEEQGREYAAVMSEVRPRDFRFFLGLPPTDEQIEEMEMKRRPTSYEERAGGKGKGVTMVARTLGENDKSGEEEKKFFGLF